MKFLDKILYKIARRLFRKYMNELVQEHVSEIAERSILVIEIVDKYFERLVESKTETYLTILLGYVEAETDDEAIGKTEKILEMFNDEIEKIEKARLEFHKVTWQETVATFMTKLASIIAILSVLKHTIEVLKTIPLEEENQCTS